MRIVRAAFFAVYIHPIAKPSIDVLLELTYFLVGVIGVFPYDYESIPVMRETPE
jgi:hypothetical protein